MKRLLLLASILFVVSGCDGASEMMSCKSTDTRNGMTTTTTYDLKYTGDELKHVTITYDYVADNTARGTNNNNIDGTNIDENDGNNNNNNNARNTNPRDVDGINADTDGIDENEDTSDGNITSNEIVDGVVGDAIDETVDTVTDTILDIAGIRGTYENQFVTYDNIDGLSYDVEVDDDDHYKVVYEIDMTKISDADLATFNVDRSFDTSRSTYEDVGYTCK